jgi:hypothetical protein
MDAMEKGDTYLKKDEKYWNIPLLSFSNHLNDIIRCRKVCPQGALIEQEDVEAMVTWVLNMQKVGLFVNL